MKKVILSLLLFLSIYTTKAQSLSPSVIASSGNFQTSGNYSLSYTIGEPVVATGVGGSSILTQGFQQPDEKEVNVQSINFDNLEIKIYPNPAFEQVNVQVSLKDNNTPVRLKFSDLLGRDISVPTAIYSDGNRKLYSMNLSNLAAAVYFITVYDEKNNSAHTFKINKLN
jgi:hypothetical protein